jgi:uncharacterized tellurite resistance protein B-like protein
MDNFLVDSATVALLSQLTGQNLTEKDLSPTVLFATALVTVLWGVIVIDQTVAIAEERELQILLNELIPADDSAYPLIEIIVQGIQQQQTYLDPQSLLGLVGALSESERLLLLGLGYEMAIADGDLDLREQLYLQAIAQRLNLPPRYQETLAAGFSRQAPPTAIAIAEVQALLQPSQFRSIEPAAKLAAQILTTLLSGDGTPLDSTPTDSTPTDSASTDSTPTDSAPTDSTVKSE